MQISVLMDDTATYPQYICEHGLSFHIKTGEHSVLFDAGTSGRAVENAAMMGISLSEVDVAMLSHGHVDHGGGLAAFLKVNEQAKVYLQADALEEHYTRRANGEVQDIGLPCGLKGNARLAPLTGDLRLDAYLTLFSSVTGREHLSLSNRAHLVRQEGCDTPDDFHHEQSLLVRDGERLALIAGCAHCGIVNILSRAMELAGRPMDAVVGGFHLSNPRDGGCEPAETVNAIAAYLMRFPTQYFTCHCTGAAAYRLLSQTMGERLHWVGSGSRFEV